MNAGKSTLINALMGEEILGSSVVPETANLSLLKYSKEAYSRVMYWSKPEWEKILRSEVFSLLQESLKQKASKISEGLINEFFENIHQPLRTLEQSLANEEALVQKSLKEYETDDKKRAELSIKIHYQLKSLQSSSVRYSI